MRHVSQFYPRGSDKIIVVAGGFSDEEMAESSKSDVDTTQLEARHEEADTRIILHCTEHHTDNVVVQSRDTDVLVLLLGHYHRMPCTNLWLKAGTAKKRQYVPVHDIVEQMSYSVQIRETIPAFHALTGSDTTSYIAGCSKKSAWKTFQTHHQLLENLGKGELTEETLKNAELFVCKLYNLKQVSTTDEARAVLFNKSRSPESLPPTSDALHFHIRRAHYQTVVWRQAHLSHPNLPNPEGLGWRVEETTVKPELMSLTPVPDSCHEIITCNCKTGCKRLHCNCKKLNLHCTRGCTCKDSEQLCQNEFS